MKSVSVSGLFIYPIKSCRGIAVDSIAVLNTGLTNDRRWMLVNEQGRFITQREIARMALIEPVIDGSGLVVRAPGMPELAVSGTSVTHGLSVSVWKDTCRAFDEGDQAAAWFSEFLGAAVRLVRFDGSQTRLSSHDWTGELDAPNQFSDGFPILAISEASLADLNSRMASQLPMNRFRPNLVLDGLDAYEEDRLYELSSAALSLRVVKPCTRCKITTIDQVTGQVAGTEPFATLMKYRRNPSLRGVTFGQNVIIRTGAGGSLHVGEVLQVTYQV